MGAPFRVGHSRSVPPAEGRSHLSKSPARLPGRNSPPQAMPSSGAPSGLRQRQAVTRWRAASEVVTSRTRDAASSRSGSNPVDFPESDSTTVQLCGPGTARNAALRPCGRIQSQVRVNVEEWSACQSAVQSRAAASIACFISTAPGSMRMRILAASVCGSRSVVQISRRAGALRRSCRSPDWRGTDGPPRRSAAGSRSRPPVQAGSLDRGQRGFQQAREVLPKRAALRFALGEPRVYEPAGERVV